MIIQECSLYVKLRQQLANLEYLAYFLMYNSASCTHHIVTEVRLKYWHLRFKLDVKQQYSVALQSVLVGKHRSTKVLVDLWRSAENFASYFENQALSARLKQNVCLSANLYLSKVRYFTNVLSWCYIYTYMPLILSLYWVTLFSKFLTFPSLFLWWNI